MTILPILIFSQMLHATPAVHDILDAQAMDRKVDPCDNFYLYSCGSWIRDFKMPADKSRYWRQGNALSDHVEENLNALLASLAGGKARTPAEKKLATFYQSCMGIEAPDVQGFNNLKERLKALNEIKDSASLARVSAQLTLIGSQGLFDFESGQDLKDSSQVIAFLDRGGMSLPDPDYYLAMDAKSKAVRDSYRDHIARTLQLFGETPEKARDAATKILAFETDLAGHSLKKDDRRDVEKLFHPMSYQEVKALMPAFDWETYLATLKQSAPKKINVNEPEFLKNLNTKLSQMKPDQLIAMLKYKLIHRSAYFIPGPVQMEDFGFWRVYLRGQKELPPRWKYCTQIVAGNLSEALGQAYVASTSGSVEIRRKTKAMFENIRAAFKSDLQSLTWMDDSTRASAQKKLAKMGSKIGWPAKWRDYGKVEISNASFYDNVLHANEFEARRDLNKIDKPTDRSEWYMSVWEPNAYYSSSDNEMVLPLGELVPPVFDPKFSDGANYSSLGGSTIGHELTHGFDDSGKDMDANGNFVTWWSAQSKELFEKQSRCYIQQTEAYEIIPGAKLHIRGKATLGENLADNGGLKLGLTALRKIMKSRKPAAKFLEFDELQQFFLAYGQSWCSKITDEQLRESLLSDYHPPAEFRVNAVLANMPEFAEAFQCKAGTKMAPAGRCSLW